MKDPITIVTRAVAERLETEIRPGRIAEVRTVLIARKSPSAPPQYGPVGLASLIVSVASLARTVYVDLRKRIAKQVRRTFPHRLRHRFGPVRSRCLPTVIGTVFTVRCSAILLLFADVPAATDTFPSRSVLGAPVPGMG